MENFRQFEVGPDPFGQTWQVRLKWMQTAISIRHSDTVDAKFLLDSGGTETEKTIAIPHADLLRQSEAGGSLLTDAWCCRLAALHLKKLVETGEDMEKNLVTVAPEELAQYDAELQRAGLTERRERRGAA